MMSTAAGANTRTEEVYDSLRSDLLNGTIAPGDKLKLVELATRFAVSQSVVREALTRLTEQGLVIATPQRGFRVRELSVRDIAELTEARIQIESITLQMAIERGDMRWETDVLTTHHILERTAVADAEGLFNEQWPGPWMQVEGEAEIERLPDAMPLLADYYRRRGQDTTTAQFRERMLSENRVLIRIRPQRVVRPGR